MARPLDRRSFLRVAGGAVAGGYLLDACGSSSSSGAAAGPAAGSGAASTIPEAKGDLVLIPNDWEFFTGTDRRVAVLLASNAHSGAPVALTHPVSLRIAPQGQPLGPVIPTVIHADSSSPSYALATHTFEHAGIWTIEATYDGHTVSLPVSVVDPSSATTPVQGQRLTSLPTPTTADALGVNPICTAQPPCPLHEVSLDAAIAGGKPIAVLFATPALCQSRFCGPVLQNLLDVHSPWAARVTFIHVEIYTDLTGQTTTKTVQAYNLEHEPMLYLAGPGGTILTRIDNLFDRGEARDALTQAFGPA